MGPLHGNRERQGQDREIGENDGSSTFNGMVVGAMGQVNLRARSENKVMWMRLCAMCKKLMLKPDLGHSVHCQCGWEW